MAGIYCADIYCDDCVEDIKNRIADELWNDCASAMTPDGFVTREHFHNREELELYLENMDERDYDSDSYPKYCSDDEESDCPQHCGSHEDCLDPTLLSDGSKVGHCFGNDLTSVGVEYVKEAVRDGGLVAELWRETYDWIDFPNECEECGRDCDDGYLCEACQEFQCVGCGEFAEQLADLDCNGNCELCGDIDDDD